MIEFGFYDLFMLQGIKSRPHKNEFFSKNGLLWPEHLESACVLEVTHFLVLSSVKRSNSVVLLAGVKPYYVLLCSHLIWCKSV